MMRKMLVIAMMLCVSLTFAQENNKVELIKKGDITEATYYYDNGVVQQHGTFNADGELHGVWTSYDVDGNKLAIGHYENGQKIGKWFFWTENNVLKEVDYDKSKIIAVNEWNNKSRLAITN